MSQEKLAVLTPQDPLIGRIVQDYQITALIGKGGIGRVYAAQHIQIGKRIAIKVLKDGISQNEDTIRRFFREAKTVNEIGHENIIDIFSFSYQPESKEAASVAHAFLLMEFLDGKTLSQVIKSQGPLDTQRLGHIGLQICSALHAVHEKNMIHRDLKSENVFLITRAGQRDFAKVLDFGLVKLQDSDGSTPITSVGVTLGTPAYMSPEQAVGEPVDALADVYSLGIMLYEMATRTLPFTASNVRDVMKKQVLAPLPPPRERLPSIPPALEAVICKSLEKEKEARYESMVALAKALAIACKIDLEPYFGGSLASIRVSPVAIADDTLDEGLATTAAAVVPIKEESPKKEEEKPAPISEPSFASLAVTPVPRQRNWLWAASLLLPLFGLILWFLLGQASTEKTAALVTETKAIPVIPTPQIPSIEPSKSKPAIVTAPSSQATSKPEPTTLENKKDPLHKLGTSPGSKQNSKKDPFDNAQDKPLDKLGASPKKDQTPKPEQPPTGDDDHEKPIQVH